MVTTPVLGFFLPVIGVAVSMGAAFWAVGRSGAALWGPIESTSRRLGVATSGFATLWLPALLQFFGVLYRLLGPEDSGRVGLTAWLIIPLARPEDPWTPAAVAMVVYALGAGASALRRRPWPWVVGGLAASLAYDLTIRLGSIGSVS